MSNEKNTHRLHQLLHSSIPENRQLAIHINKSNNLNLDLSVYVDCYQYLVETAQLDAGLTDVMDILLAFEQLKELTIEGDHKAIVLIEKSAPFFGNLLRCRLIDLPISEVPIWVFKFTKLRHLQLIQLPITEISPNLGQLTQLQLLKIQQCPLRSLPNVFDQLPQLTYLYLCKNKLTQLPKSIYQLHFLERLDISYNDTFELSEQVKHLQKLRILVLHGTTIKKLPKTLLDLPNLQGVLEHV
jgi:Leucine-rich repeat (LRR) protein